MTNPDGPSPPWRAALDFDAQPADHYLDHWNESLMTFVEGEPRRALDAGCAGGLFGAKLKERVPGIHVTGIEAGRAAAERAATRLDRVIHAPLESVDFAAAAIGPGSLDLVVVADVLEHLVDPWGFLAKARPLLAPGGRLLYATCSIFRDEGQHRIDAFLQRLGPGAARLDPRSPGHLLPLADNGGEGTRGEPAPDGFFYALIEKT